MDLIESASAMNDRAPRIAVAGGADAVTAVAREIAALGAWRLCLIGGSPGEGEEMALAVGGGAVAGKDLGAVRGCGLVILAGDGPRVGEADGTAACVARYAAEAVVVVAAERSLPRGRAFLNASRLPPRQVLAVGGLARRQAHAVSLATRLGVSVSQVSLLLVGGEDEPDLMELRRYTVAAGIPVELLKGALEPEPDERDRSIRTAAPNAPRAARGFEATARAAALIADAVLRDRRR